MLLSLLLCCQTVLAQEEPCGQETGTRLRIASTQLVLNSVFPVPGSGWHQYNTITDIPDYLLLGTRDGLLYKMSKLQSRFEESQSSEAELRAFSDLAEDFGAPRVEGIILGEDLDGATRQILSLPLGVRSGLVNLYVHCGLIAPKREWRINLAKFGRQAFGTMAPPSTNFLDGVQHLLDSRKLRLAEKENVQPSLVLLSPAPDSVVGSQPTIRFRLSTGDYRKRQVSLRTLSIMVDGKQRANRALIHTEIDESLEEGVAFEVLTISLSPKLTPGVHSVEVRAQAGESPSTPENTITERWTFTVSDSLTPVFPSD